MDNTFILNPSLDTLDIKDAIDERLTKAQAITSCLLANSSGDSDLPYNEIYAVVWMIDALLEELDQLFINLAV
jgi:hypothetical protein